MFGIDNRDTRTTRQAVETFHLVFLRALVAKGEHKALIALKGGCNLRFYFGSVRYSEPDRIELYEARAEWETMQETVVTQLEAILERR
jgi:hypothetical protein